ncbi:unnamed protein product [Cylindrotheca closterium]|uniref:SAC domain-containing protein n=1 Tax=Cylindrotheca closterium TaxID=2856 RepID=A0AAD2CW67_9STRA|nr:unnamed protein product [Cylindrotheca closterium]
MIRRHYASSKLIPTILWVLFALSNIQLSISSSSSISPLTSIISPKNEPAEKPKKRTIVSGFGSHHTKHSIFASPTRGSTESKTISTKKANKRQQGKESSIIGADFDFSSNSLLVYKQDKENSSEKDGDVDHHHPNAADSIVWLMDPHTNQRVCIWVNEEGDWMAELVEEGNSSIPMTIPPQPKPPTSSSEMNGWVPVEGIYGFYKVPTGILLVLIAKTRNVFDAPPLRTIQNWWKIDKVQQLEVVHLSNSKAQQELSPIQIKEEIRQLRLLRKAWKQHDFYCCQNNKSMVNDNEEERRGDQEDSLAICSKNPPIVRDMTKSLQSSFLVHHQQQQQQRERKRSRKSDSEPHWWTANPDPRFFWNQLAVEPILAKCNFEEFEQDPSRMDPCIYFLLDHTIPVTSAFVGIQSDITCGSTNDDDNDEEKSKSPRCTYTQLLISRRSRFRAGTRFTRRGADSNGAVANYVETEQVLLLKSQQNETDGTTIDRIASHVQTRGSIPIRWSSPADVKTYRPKVHIGTDPLAQARALRWHLLEQQAHYVLQEGRKGKPNNSNSNSNNHQKAKDENNESEMVFVNLVDKQSDQGRLGKAFDEVLQAVLEIHSSSSSSSSSTNSSSTTAAKGIKAPLVKHVWYDFHAEVKNGKWDRLSILLKDLEPYLMAHNYFVVSTTGTTTKNDKDKKKNNKKKNTNIGYQIESKQTSVVRTNCMDCLDRTNVVQSILGRYVLFDQLLGANNNTQTKKEKKQLQKQFRKSKQLSLPWPQSEINHRALWADNADEISRLYAGTNALKRDFTRTGQRTKLGALDDGMNSLQRYYLNNFMDADRQEGMDLMVGYASFTTNGESSSSHKDSGADNDDDPDKEEGNIFATRRSFLGGLFQPHPSLLPGTIGGETGDDNVDHDQQEEEDDEQDALDLRWVPGDLQEHLRSRAKSERTSTTTTTTAGTKLKFGFSSTRALKAMDDRSTSDLPWWSLVEDAEEASTTTESKSSSSTVATTNTDSNDSNNNSWLMVEKLAPHQRHPTVTRTNVLSILFIGLKAPMTVAMGMSLFLGVLYFQDIWRHDWNLVERMATKMIDSWSNRQDQDGDEYSVENDDDEEEYDWSDDEDDQEEEEE